MSNQHYPYRRPVGLSVPGYRKLVTTTILAVALIGFETFNFSTTAYALGDLLGPLSFLGVPWSTMLAIAFCAIDFAGVARLFLPESDQNAPNELWFLFGAWLLGATMNAVLTWWGISMAIVNRTLVSTAIISPQVLTHTIPVFVAILVWITRILLIGSFSISTKPAAVRERRPQAERYDQPAQQPLIVRRKERQVPAARPETALPRSQPLRPIYQPDEPESEDYPEPVYVPMDAAYHSLSASSQNKPNQSKRF